jgi:hypothetical protein
MGLILLILLLLLLFGGLPAGDITRMVTVPRASSG